METIVATSSITKVIADTSVLATTSNHTSTINIGIVNASHVNQVINLVSYFGIGEV